MASKPRSKPYHPPDVSQRDVGAIQALSRGEADEASQRHALSFIIESLAGTYDQSYRPDSPRDTDFAEGRRFVGLQLVKLTKVDPDIYKEK